MPDEPPKRSKSRYLWAGLIARIYGVFPLLCSIQWPRWLKQLKS